ncbi:hypothetical protein OSB04_020385 [Centaurea solstitialis]|uniref:Uncharacterized protein n=1 Tax=Centaurea solstitialis TaxID=347529 RepID=A0AA38TAK2_9ASTR|nr:hypothetical protein OSB04_020385 [Centaurea solstitialis]
MNHATMIIAIFNLENKVSSLNNAQMGFWNLEIKDEIGESCSQMYLAKGIGVDVGFGCRDGGGGGGGDRSLSLVARGVGDGDGGDGDVEEHYRKMMNENPRNPLCLGNYAKFLYQLKQDLPGANSRAIFVDPNDGEIFSQYVKLLWELHHDKDRATSYFKRAIHAASEDR